MLHKFESPLSFKKTPPRPGFATLDQILANLETPKQPFMSAMRQHRGSLVYKPTHTNKQTVLSLSFMPNVARNQQRDVFFQSKPKKKRVTFNETVTLVECPTQQQNHNKDDCMFYSLEVDHTPCDFTASKNARTKRRPSLGRARKVRSPASSRVFYSNGVDYDLEIVTSKMPRQLAFKSKSAPNLNVSLNKKNEQSKQLIKSHSYACDFRDNCYVYY